MSAQRIHEREVWHAQLAALPAPHILQTWDWGEFKRQTTGWTPERWADEAGRWALSLLVKRRAGLAVAYAPKGPLLADEGGRGAALDFLQKRAQALRAIWLKIDPDIWLGTGLPPSAPPDPARPPLPDPQGAAWQADLSERGWHFSRSQVQFRNTLRLDLSLSTDDLLAGMNQSTRRKLRQAEKAGVRVRPADLSDPAEVARLYALYTETGARGGFLIRPLAYYARAWADFSAAGLARATIAEVGGAAVAGAVFYHFGTTVWYFYGMSSQTGREAQPNYALHWEAIRWAQSAGYRYYDWWGAPNHFSESDPMWGVYRFKEGWGGQVLRGLGAWDYSALPLLYTLAEGLGPRLRAWLGR